MSTDPLPRTSRFGPGFDPASLTTSDECLEALAGVDDDLEHIKAQLLASSARYHANGERGDPMWYAKAKAALGYKGKLRQRVQERLGQLRRAEKMAAHAMQGERFERRFIDAAKRLLPRETFDEILKDAQRSALNGAEG